MIPPPALCSEIYHAARDFFTAQERLYILTKAAGSREELLLDWKRGGAKPYRQFKNSEQCQLSHIVRITPLPVMAKNRTDKNSLENNRGFVNR